MPFFNSLLYYQTNPATFEKICISKLQPFIIFHFIRTFSPTFYTVIKPTLPIFICFKVTAIHSCDGNSFPKTTHLPLFFSHCLLPYWHCFLIRTIAHSFFLRNPCVLIHQLFIFHFLKALLCCA